VSIGAWFAKRAGFPALKSAAALTVLAMIILIGSKGLYSIEMYLFPLDDIVPLRARGATHGFRIPGGILLLAALGPFVVRALGLPWRQFGDAVVPLAAVALVFVRIGCFLNGCCFGAVSSLPWALRFPRGSLVYAHHHERMWISPHAEFSLPVQPLQLYFVLAAAATVGILFWLQRRHVAPGGVQLAFYLLFFTTTAFLEPIRANYLTVNNIIVPAACVAAAVILLRNLMVPLESVCAPTGVNIGGKRQWTSASGVSSPLSRLALPQHCVSWVARGLPYPNEGSTRQGLGVARGAYRVSGKRSSVLLVIP
jgi:prolipoprotein diacylglyceryltransferase